MKQYLPLFWFAAIGGFLLLPSWSQAALILPTTVCDQQQIDFQIYGVTAHLTDTSIREDGTRAFAYGANGQPFVSADTSGVVTFNFHTLFSAPTTTVSYVKLMGFSADCAPVYGLGPAFTYPVSPGDHVLTYAESGHTVTFDGETQIQRPSATARYIWIEAWDGVSGSASASYSYLVDLQDIKNPVDDSIYRLTPDPVIIIPGIMGSAEKNGKLVIDPILHTYDDLIATLEANGYQEGYDLFTFPYEWRDSNTQTALRLMDKINEVKGICHCDKVDLVAHSMGGLVARQYIQSGHYQGDVDQLIFLGTPHLGSQESYLTWEAGETQNDFYSQLMELYFTAEAMRAGYSNVLQYVRNRPVISVQELLPTVDYIRDKGTGEIRQYSSNYPVNQFLENLNSHFSNLLSSRVNITNIVGNSGNNTIEIIRVGQSEMPGFWEHGEPEMFYGVFGDQGLERGAGDDTVTFSSATNNGILSSEEINATHRRIPTAAAGEIFQTLTNHTATTTLDHGLNFSPKILLLQLLSPVDFVVIAPDGKKIGKNLATGEEYNEIPYAFYSGYNTDNEYITILNPEDGEYKLQLQGTGSGGEYTVVTSYVSDQTSVSREFTATILPDQLAALDLSVDNSAPESLSLQPEDTIPPVIAITEPSKDQYLHSEFLPIQAEVTDTGTGVKTVDYYFNSAKIATSTVDLFYQPLGPATIAVSAADYAGNAATSTKEITIIATLDSTISDISRAYDLGWITNKNARNSLINRVKRIVRLEKRLETILERSPDGKNIKKRIEHLEKIIDRAALALLKLEFNLYHKKGFINEEAYIIIKEDIEWIINH